MRQMGLGLAMGPVGVGDRVRLIGDEMVELHVTGAGLTIWDPAVSDRGTVRAVVSLGAWDRVEVTPDGESGSVYVSGEMIEKLEG